MTVICSVAIVLCAQQAFAQTCIDGDRVVSASFEKPSSENHRWSYQRACERALAEVERELGRGWLVESIRYDDQGRKTNTSHKWTSKRKWKCTHTVKAIYRACRITDLTSLAKSGAEIKYELKETYVMSNPYYNEANKTAFDALPQDKRDGFTKGSTFRTQHTFAHAAEEMSALPLDHITTFQIASRGCRLEIYQRHSHSQKISDLQITDHGRETEFVFEDETSYYKYLHRVSAKYTVTRMLVVTDSFQLGISKSDSHTITSSHAVTNPVKVKGKAE